MTIVNLKIKKFSCVIFIIILSNQLDAGIIKKAVVGGAVVGAVALASQQMHPLSVGKLYWKDVKNLAISQEPFSRNIHACHVTAFKNGSLHFPCTSEGKPIWGKNLSAEYIEYPRFWILKKDMNKNLYYFLIQERVKLLELNDGGFAVVLANGLEDLFWETYIKTASSNIKDEELNSGSIEKKVEEIVKLKNNTVSKEEKQKIAASFKKIGTNDKNKTSDKEEILKQSSNTTAKTNSDIKEDTNLSTQLMPLNMQQYYRFIKTNKKKASEKDQIPIVVPTLNPTKDINNTIDTKNPLDKNITKDRNLTIDGNVSKDENLTINSKFETENKGKI